MTTAATILSLYPTSLLEITFFVLKLLVSSFNVQLVSVGR